MMPNDDFVFMWEANYYCPEDTWLSWLFANEYSTIKPEE